MIIEFWIELMILSINVVAMKPNILMISSDDMRPELSGSYGADYMHTPNLKKLANKGFTFRRAYVQYALCAPSRTVLLTGRRPDTSRVWTIGPYFRDTTGGDWITLPQFFKQHNYQAIGMGKVFHIGEASGLIIKNGTIIRYGDDYPASWSVPFYHAKDPYNHYNKTHPNPRKDGKGSPLVGGPIDAPWQTFWDGKLTTNAITWLRNLTSSGLEKPFFMAIGYHRPHVPWIYPKQFDIYANSSVPFPPKDYYIPKNIPVCAPHDWTSEMAIYGDMLALPMPENGVPFPGYQSNLSTLCAAVPNWKQKDMKRYYWSAITYIDFLIGQLLEEVQTLGLWNSTTIIFWGDHGYKLGEHCDWFKHDNYEDSTRIPLIIKPASGLVSDKQGIVIDTLVEEVDIYPSLIDLHGFAVPEDLEGTSWVPLLQGKKQDRISVNQYSHYCQPGANKTGVCTLRGQPYKGPVMGYSLRTDQWRYTEWCKFNCQHLLAPMNCTGDLSPQWNLQIGVELYDHRNDTSKATFGSFENANLAHNPAYIDVIKKLSEQLHQQF